MYSVGESEAKGKRNNSLGGTIGSDLVDLC